MEDIIAQFIKLPPHVKTAVSSAQAIEKLEAIESRYNVKLADIVMRVAVKNISVVMLPAELERRLSIQSDKAKAIAKDMTMQLFSQIAGFLGFTPEASPEAVLLSSPAHEASLGIEGVDQEIEKHAAHLSYAPTETTFDVSRLVDQLLDVLNIGFDHVMKKRFHTIIESRLVDVRDKLMVKDQLMRSPKIGGMGFSEVQMNRVVPIIEQAWEDVHAKHLKIKEVSDVQKHPTRMVTPPTPKHPSLLQQREPSTAVPPPTPHVLPVKTILPKPKVELPKVKVQPPVPVFSIPPITPPIAPISVAPKKEPLSTPVQHMPEDFPLAHPIKDVPHFMPKVRRDFEAPEKTMMQDIVPPSKLVGPIEELEQMEAEDFRHLGDSPEDSADRLKEKIRMLEKQSFELRSAGIKAWRSSPLMKEYLDIGRESIEKTHDIKQLIADRRVQNPQAMTSEEFDAISSVNTSLRY
ncbi:MAG: hypothetical protein WC495_03200 [Patescibacteria group bacterium]|jgi:hypothetical protein